MPASLGYDTVDSIEGEADGFENKADVVSEWFLSFLEDRKSKEPFFASVGMYEPHRPYFDSNTDSSDVAPPLYLPDNQGVREDVAALQETIRELDRGVGRVVDALDEQNELDDSILVFTTDHGIAFPRAKGTCYDPGIETALIIRYPGHITPGERFDSLLSNVDLAPTLLDLVDHEIPDQMDGQSFASLFDGRDFNERDSIFVEMTWHDYYNPIRGIRTDRFKYLRNFWQVPSVYLPNDVFASPSGRTVREEFYTTARVEEELYDLAKDPHEKNNVAGNPAYESELNSLRESVRHRMKNDGDPLQDGVVHPPENETEFSCPVCDR